MDIKLSCIGGKKYVEIQITNWTGNIMLGPYDEKARRTVADQLRAVANEIDPPDEGEKA